MVEVSFDPPPFSVDVERNGAELVVRPRGELDLATVPHVAEATAQAVGGEVDRLVLDLGSLDFMDSSGLRYVIIEHDRAGREGYELVILPGPPAVQRVFDIARLTPHLPFAGA
jgi:anti-anti-sigma factor